MNVTIWENEIAQNGSTKTFLVATVEKRYADKTGEWKSTNRYTKRDLMDVTNAVQQALAHFELHEHRAHVEAERQRDE